MVYYHIERYGLDQQKLLIWLVNFTGYVIQNHWFNKWKLLITSFKITD